MVTALTGNIKVSVHCKYQPEFSDPLQNRFLFSYQIRIENTGSDSVQLLSRYWNIINANGQRRHVEGEGVVGEQPVLEPGEIHEYSSACDLDTSMGAMDGFYVFENLTDHSGFKADIPRFVLEAEFSMS